MACSGACVKFLLCSVADPARRGGNAQRQRVATCEHINIGAISAAAMLPQLSCY